MLAFASLFLGLVFGVQEVELIVGERVAAVELFLDGTPLGTLREPPWVMECDLGEALAPRLLEAVARDAAGEEIARVEQWLNLPQPQAVMGVTLEAAGTDGGRTARVTWESTAGAEPEAATASLDGMPLEVDDPRRLVLPPVDENRLHLLQVELRFDDGVASRADVTFGGIYADEVHTEMTALPLLAIGAPRRPPTLEAVQGWLLADGEPVRVVAVEKGLAEIVVVMGRPFPHLFLPGERVKVPKPLSLGEDERVRFVSTVPRQSQGVASTFELFPTSPAYDRKVGDLYQLLTGMMRPAESRPPRQAAAVAVAGLAAFEGRHRRAVVLIPSIVPGGEDGIGPREARRYLQSLHVPFVLWQPERAPVPSAWGEPVPARSLKELSAAFRQLSETLDRQWIVWLDGRHLPQSITLTPEAAGFELLR